MPITPLLGRAGRAVALDDVQLALGRVALGAVGELAREREALQRRFADDEVTRLLRGVARAGGGQTLLDDRLGLAGILLEERPEGLAQHLLDVSLHFGVHQLDFGLRFELRLAVLDADDAPARRPNPRTPAARLPSAPG